MRNNNQGSVLFAAIICIISSAILATLWASWKPRYEVNKENDRKQNVLAAFGQKEVSKEEITKFFSENIREIFVNADGTVSEITRPAYEELTKKNRKISDKTARKAAQAKEPLPLYIWSEEGKDTAYGFPMSGMGLWSVVHSYVAIEADLETIKGITFYGHEETPGLGGECSKPWFMDNFAGKRLFENSDPVDFKVVKGKVEDTYPEGHDSNDNAVDGMSGATITGNGIMDFINEFIPKYDPYFDSLKG